MITKLLRDESDERYRYLIRHGNLHFIERESKTLYVELPQIPNVVVIYRRPVERTSNADKLSLEHRGLKSVPLLEGEEKLKQLNLAHNEIVKIENMVSLPNLTFLDISHNRISEMAKMPVFQQLKALILSKNFINAIENLDGFPNLDVLDLSDNRI